MSKHQDAIEIIKDKMARLEADRLRVNDKKLLAQQEVDSQDRELQVIEKQIARLNDSVRALSFEAKLTVDKAPGYDLPHL